MCQELARTWNYKDLRKSGPDGQVHAERFASSLVGDRAKRIAETQHAYSNSFTSVDKMSLEQQMQHRDRKTVEERVRESDERQTDVPRHRRIASNMSLINSGSRTQPRTYRTATAEAP